MWAAPDPGASACCKSAFSAPDSTCGHAAGLPCTGHNTTLQGSFSKCKFPIPSWQSFLQGEENAKEAGLAASWEITQTRGKQHCSRESL